MRRFHLNDIKLRDKWLLMYILSVFIPIVLTNVIFYHVTTTHIKNQKNRDATMAMEKTRSEVQAIIDEAAGVSYQYYSDPVLSSTLKRDYASPLDYIETYHAQLKGMLDKTNLAHPAVKRVDVYSGNPTILPSGSIERITDQLRGEAWYQQYMSLEAPHPVLLHTGEALSLVQRLDSFEASSYPLFIKIELNMRTLLQRLDNSTFDGKLYLVGGTGAVEYTTDAGVDWQSGSMPLSSIVPEGKVIHFELPYENRTYMAGWKLHGIMDEKVVLEEVRKSWVFVIYLACVNFLLPSIIIIAMSRSMHVRLVHVLRHMKKVKNQNFEEIPDEAFRDEIGQLTGEFNRMTTRIRSLIDDVYIADIQKKDLELKRRQAQLHALHSQINPHFMFNVLESVRMRSLMKGEGETAKIIQNMAKIFRKSILWQKDWIQVREELELIECFLEIQKYRFGDKLDYRISVDPSAYEVYIPKMTLLPFVENASIHGIESSPRKGLIVIHVGVNEAEGQLVFSVRDNGIGMPPGKLDEIITYLKTDDSMGDRVGMKNAYYRLVLCFNDAFRFRIESEEGIGTFVHIGMPLGEAEELPERRAR